MGKFWGLIVLFVIVFSMCIYAEDDVQEEQAGSLAIAKNAIKQKALDVAKQIEIYLEAYPDKTVLDLQNDSYFIDIAVQTVGQTGYTLVEESETLIMRFHKFDQYIDFDMHNTAEQFPKAFSISSRAKGGHVSDGFYDWQDPDGVIREKYIYVTPVYVKTADNVSFLVAASTYIDEYRNILQDKTSLTVDEELWISDHKELILGTDRDWKPFDFEDDLGVHQGICSDYVNIASDALGIDMDRQSKLSWTDMIERAKQKRIDIIPCIVETPSRSEYLLFTEPYLNLPIVLVVNEDSPLIENFDDMNGKKLAVIKGFAMTERLREDYPNIIPVSVDNLDVALDLVSKGEVDGTTSTFAAIKYTAQAAGLKNLRISVPTPYYANLSFAVRKDLPEMIPLLEKVLTPISDVQKKNIQDKWVNVTIEEKTDWVLITKISTFIILGFTIVIASIVFSMKKYEQRLEMEVDKRTKELQKANTKVSKMLAKRTEFMNQVAHDLKTPLTPIKLIVKKIFHGQKLSSNMKKDLAILERNSDSLSYLISDVLDISRIDNDGAHMEYTQEDLREITKEVMEDLKVMLKKENMRIKFKASSIALNITLDKNKMKQVITNIVSNSIKHSKTKNKYLEINIRKTSENILMSFKDKGIGLEKGDLKKIFEDFFTLAQYQGGKSTGLGLSICLRIIKLHKGKIWAESYGLGKGTTILFSIPIKQKNNSKKE